MFKAFAITLIKFYQKAISVVLGPRCRFSPTCSSYSIECFESFPAPLALWYSAKRICKCHPFHPGGFDPVSDIRSPKKD